MEVPAAVVAKALIHHEDERGHLTEVLRHSWTAPLAPTCWTVHRRQDLASVAAGQWFLRPDGPGAGTDAVTADALYWARDDLTVRLWPGGLLVRAAVRDVPAMARHTPSTRIDGVVYTALPAVAGIGERLFDQAWGTGITPVQWNLVMSRPNTLRGVHVHPTHVDYLTVLRGCLHLRMRDLRRTSPSFGAVEDVAVHAEDRVACTIPPGVSHGFAFVEETAYLYAVSHYWSMADELGCRWDDPELEMSWPLTTPLVSERDRTAPSLADLMTHLDGLTP